MLGRWVRCQDRISLKAHLGANSGHDPGIVLAGLHEFERLGPHNWVASIERMIEQCL